MPEECTHQKCGMRTHFWVEGIYVLTFATLEDTALRGERAGFVWHSSQKRDREDLRWLWVALGLTRRGERGEKRGERGEGSRETFLQNVWRRVNALQNVQYRICIILLLGFSSWFPLTLYTHANNLLEILKCIIVKQKLMLPVLCITLSLSRRRERESSYGRGENTIRILI